MLDCVQNIYVLCTEEVIAEEGDEIGEAHQIAILRDQNNILCDRNEDKMELIEREMSHNFLKRSKVSMRAL